MELDTHGRIKLSPDAAAMVEEISDTWQLNRPCEELLRIAAEQRSLSQACYEVLSRENLVVRDARGAEKAHCLALLAHNLLQASSSTLQRLLGHLA